MSSSTNVPSGASIYSASAGAISSNALNSAVRSTRAPNSTDVKGPQGNFAIGQTWVDTASGDYYVLVGITSSNGLVSATWDNLSGGGGSSGIETINGISPDGGHDFTISAGSGVSITPGTNSITVGLTGGSTAIDSITVDAATGPGTNPVLPASNGSITITGAQVAAGTTANVIRTDSLAANTLTVEIQRSSAQASSTVGSNGVAHFSSDQFAVDSNGFVTLVGGGSAVDSIGVQAATAPGTNPVLPNGSGVINFAISQTLSTGQGTPQFVSEAANTVSIDFMDDQRNLVINGYGVGFGAAVDNTGLGGAALRFTTGDNNTAVGSGTTGCLGSLTTGENNTAVGCLAGTTIVSGDGNSIFGSLSGSAYVGAESNNIILGYNIPGVAAETNVLRIGAETGTSSGQLNAAYIAGIGTIVVTGDPVLVSTDDQLGVASSSKRFKNNIRDMGDDSSPLMKLRPVTFNWDKESAPGLKNAPDEKQYGLISEEVHETFPYLCKYGEDGKPFSVKYHELASILLNEVQKLRKEVDALKSAK